MSSMKSILNPEFPQNIFQQQTHSETYLRPQSGVRQDKSASLRDRRASDQPERIVTVLRSQHVDKISVRSENSPNATRKTVPVTLWVKPYVKAELQRLVQREKDQGDEDISLSFVGGSFLERGLQQNVDMQYGAMLTPIIEKAIDRRMRARDNRLVALLVRIAFETGQIRGIVTNHLAIEPGITNENIQTVLTESEKEAKSNITRRTPQIAEIIEELKQWMTDEEGKKT
jgi:hypothetical protein